MFLGLLKKNNLESSERTTVSLILSDQHGAEGFSSSTQVEAVKELKPAKI
jgi:hypothetical protein